MPGGDRMGPRGLGPMTGRRAGYCAGYSTPGFANPLPGFGRQAGFVWPGGRNRGGGYGWRHCYYATGLPAWARGGYQPVTPEQELTSLKNEAEFLKDRLETINKRISELEEK